MQQHLSNRQFEYFLISKKLSRIDLIFLCSRYTSLLELTKKRNFPKILSLLKSIGDKCHIYQNCELLINIVDKILQNLLFH